jgi:hypothetical protein
MFRVVPSVRSNVAVASRSVVGPSRMHLAVLAFDRQTPPSPPQRTLAPAQSSLQTAMLISTARTILHYRRPLPHFSRPVTLRMVQTRSAKASLSHEERTATEPRDESLHAVTIDQIIPVNDRMKRFRLAVKDRKTLNVLSATPAFSLDVR